MLRADERAQALRRLMAYAARYGAQPRSESEAMTVDELARFNDAVAWLMEQEGGPGGGGRDRAG